VKSGTNSIRELISALGTRSLPERGRRFFGVCLDSCKNSKINFFFQIINFCLIVLLFWFILPSQLEFLKNMGDLIGSIVGNFVLWSLSIALCPINKLFETSIKATIAIFLTVISVITLCYVKPLVKILSVLKLHINKSSRHSI